MAAPHSSLDDRKRAAREDAKRVLLGCDPAAGQLVADRIIAAGLVAPRAVVAGFFPMGREIDMSPLLRALREGGHVVALPRTPKRGLPLSFHRWALEDDLEAERFGTMTSTGPVVQPDLLLVPMLAFDRRGYRLGYGGGYYDRTIAARPGIQTIGCAYAVQERPEVPAGPMDQPLRWIVTDREAIAI